MAELLARITDSPLGSEVITVVPKTLIRASGVKSQPPEKGQNESHARHVPIE